MKKLVKLLLFVFVFKLNCCEWRSGRNFNTSEKVCWTDKYPSGFLGQSDGADDKLNKENVDKSKKLRQQALKKYKKERPEWPCLLQNDEKFVFAGLVRGRGCFNSCDLLKTYVRVSRYITHYAELNGNMVLDWWLDGHFGSDAADAGCGHVFISLNKHLNVKPTEVRHLISDEDSTITVFGKGKMIENNMEVWFAFRLLNNGAIDKTFGTNGFQIFSMLMLREQYLENLQGSPYYKGILQFMSKK